MNLEIAPPTESASATHITAEEIEAFRERLLDIREQLTGQVQNLARTAMESTEATEHSKSPLDSAENASDTYEQDFAFLSIESEEELLAKVEDALERIRDGNYGLCAATGVEIPKERLDIMPWADLCIRAQQMEEEGSLVRRQGDYGEEFEMTDPPEENLSAGDDN